MTRVPTFVCRSGGFDRLMHTGSRHALRTLLCVMVLMALSARGAIANEPAGFVYAFQQGNGGANAIHGYVSIR
jgi:hypothetical protein